MASKLHSLWVTLAATLLLTLCLPMAAIAQAKPKRDITRDQVTTPRKSARPAFKAKPTKSQSHTSRVTKPTKSTSTPQQEVSQEPFLRVNQLPRLSRSYEAKGGDETFEVNASSSDWYVNFLPSWCTASRMGSRFTITCQPNPGYEPRSSWFEVRSKDGLQRVHIDVQQEAWAAQGGITTCRLWHNLKWHVNEHTGRFVLSKHTLCVDVSGKVDGPRNGDWYVYVQFRYPDNTWVKCNRAYSLCKYFSNRHDGELLGLSNVSLKADGTF